MKRTPLKRKAAMRRTSKPLARKTRLRCRSTKRSAQERIYSARVKAWKLENPRCCFPGCHSRTRDCHHAAGREGSLLLDERHWKPLCRPHHDWVGENGNAAKSMGLKS